MYSFLSTALSDQVAASHRLLVVVQLSGWPDSYLLIVSSCLIFCLPGEKGHIVPTTHVSWSATCLHLHQSQPSLRGWGSSSSLQCCIATPCHPTPPPLRRPRCCLLGKRHPNSHPLAPRQCCYRPRLSTLAPSTPPAWWKTGPMCVVWPLLRYQLPWRRRAGHAQLHRLLTASCAPYSA